MILREISPSVELLELQRVAYAVETELIGDDRIPQLSEDARAAGRRVLVSTGRDNAPARRLFERLGFSWRDDVEVLPGLWVSRYELPRRL